ncbi:MAG: hypothetical protein NUV78_03400 [Candidatus Zambryskibacteria bacterium]|nr:hypothetical protein [Candidatus Zambryskibacteria bacterium]
MMKSISVHDTEALSSYYRDHIYDPGEVFEWIRWADRVIMKNALLGILAGLLALAICTSHKKQWQLKHWLSYKKTSGTYIKR